MPRESTNPADVMERHTGVVPQYGVRTHGVWLQVTSGNDSWDPDDVTLTYCGCMSYSTPLSILVQFFNKKASIHTWCTCLWMTSVILMRSSMANHFPWTFPSDPQADPICEISLDIIFSSVTIWWILRVSYNSCGPTCTSRRGNNNFTSLVCTESLLVSSQEELQHPTDLWWAVCPYSHLFELLLIKLYHGPHIYIWLCLKEVEIFQ